YGLITYVTDLARIPVEAEKYDLILCTQVLEHVPDPRTVLKEFYRVLKEGGALWVSAPLFYTEHQVPYDFYRYTQYGFKHLLEEAGFQIERVERLEGYYGTLAYEMDMAARVLPVSAKQYGGGPVGLLAGLAAAALKPVFFLLSLLYSRLDLRYKNVSAGHCKNYAAVARKPETKASSSQITA
ncbi:MAG: class I SAM-dependent methyltransferase, partial [Chloroflexota bacterium]